jgi:hypothetical protein
MSSNHQNGPGWGSIEDAYSDLEESTDPTINPTSAPPVAQPPNPFLDEQTDPGLFQTSSPSLPAAHHPTGAYGAAGFTPPPGHAPPQGGNYATGPYNAPNVTPPHGHAPAQPNPYPTGAYSSPGFTPPPGHPSLQPGAAPTGAYSSPGFTPPGGAPLTPGAAPIGSQSSPGFSPPTGANPAAHNAEHFSGQFTIPTAPPTGANPAVHNAEHFTGSFTIPTAAVTQQHQAVQAAPSTEDMNAKRFTYGLWGSVAGCVVGVALGVGNALVEGVSLSNGMTPLIIYSFVCMAALGGSAAATPHVFENLLRNIGLIDE